MSKQKTHKSASKRFKITGSGKVSHRSHKIRHLISKKRNNRMRSLKQDKILEGKPAKKIKKLLGKA